MENVVLIQIALEAWGAFWTFICGVAAYLGRQDEPHRSKLLTNLLFADTLLLINTALAWAYDGVTTPLGFWITRVSNFLVFLLPPGLACLMMLYLRERITANHGTLVPFWFYAAFWVSAADGALIAVSQGTDFLYFFDDSNRYHRSPHFWICSVAAVVLLMILLTIVLRHRRNLSRMEVLALLLYVLIPLPASVIQAFRYGFSLDSVAITVSLLLLYLTYEIEKSRRLARQKELLMQNQISLTQQQLELSQKDAELARARIQISISQMRPHFIFNALGSIEQLCKTQPTKAASATHQFAKYLRSNLNAMASPEQISFREELEHIRAYVWLENMRFGEDLCFREEIQVDSFTIPALSVQPLVENSIKHGMMGKEEGNIHVVLSTWEENDAFYVRVSDDGCGFDPHEKPKDTNIHIGLFNLKERIRIMCGGTVEVTSKPNQGTTVTIQIPK